MQDWIDVFANYKMEQIFAQLIRQMLWQMVLIYIIYLLFFYPQNSNIFPIILLILSIYSGGYVFLRLVKKVAFKDRILFFNAIFPCQFKLLSMDRYLGIRALYLFCFAWILLCLFVFGGYADVDWHFLIKFIFIIFTPALSICFFMIFMHSYYVYLKVRDLL